MQFNFDIKTEKFLKLILKNALNQKIRVFFVGGAVRDNLLGAPIKDVDLIVLGNAIDFCSKISELNIKSIHKDFYTVKVSFENKIYDIASTRTEKYPYSGCLPVVDEVGVELERDVKRRDFTVNSLYCELNLFGDEIRYSLIDLIGGCCDLKNKKLCVLHNRSYIDDPTRILRGLGFKYRFNFDFSIDDYKLINEYLKNPIRDNMSVSRVEEVFKKIFRFNFALPLFREVLEKKYYRILFDVDSCVNLGKVEKIISEFQLNEKDVSEFLFLLLENKTQEKLEINSLSQALKSFSKFKMYDLAYYFYKTSDINVTDYLKASEIKLFTTGDDLIKLGYKKGKLFSEIFDLLLTEKLKNPSVLSTLTDELAFIRKSFPLD